MPDFTLETRCQAAGHRIIAGIDEVGRGPLAGPVVAAAVVLDPADIPLGLNDSKKLSPKVRARLADEIAGLAHVGIGEATVAEIDSMNIAQATYAAMRRAVAALPVTPDMLLIDGRLLPPGLTSAALPIVGGDGLSVSISAASIVAKVHRDAGMVGLAQQHPHYGWERNKGYGTPEHMLGLKSHGPSPHHRRSFSPVRDMLWQAK